MKNLFIVVFVSVTLFSCSKSSNPPQVTPLSNFSLSSLSVNGVTSQTSYKGVTTSPTIKFKFSTAIDPTSVTGNILLKNNAGTTANYNTSYDNDSVIVITPATSLSYLTKYFVSVSTALKSTAGGNLNSSTQVSLLTSIDSTDKFPQISDDALLELVQRQTFKYF